MNIIQFANIGRISFRSATVLLGRQEGNGRSREVLKSVAAGVGVSIQASAKGLAVRFSKIQQK